MYLFKNAYLSIIRNKGRNILLAIIITAITLSSCIAITIHKSGNTLVESYKNNNPLEVSFNLNRQEIRNSETTISPLTIEEIETYADSKYVLGYYYTLEASLNAKDIAAIDNSQIFEKSENMPENEKNRGFKNEKNIADFRITAFSDIAYNQDFIDGKKKIIDGNMIEKDSTQKEIIISQALAEENELIVGDTITFYSSDDETYTCTIIGIFENSEETETDNFMNINAMNADNQIYTNISTINEMLEEKTNTNINAKYYIDSKDYESFTEEIKEKGLNEYYTISNNEDEVTKILEPIQNISNFSLSFLIIILIIGATILTIVNIINIRDRKYEIGVLRAIGMTKIKVTMQLMLELLIISLISLSIGASIGSTLSQPVATTMLKNEIESIETAQNNITENFGPGNFERPSINRNQTTENITYIDTLKVSTDWTTIIQLFGVSILLTIISSVVSITFINKYEPNKILQNRN